jgi:DNA-binding transcriptional MerR regulator
MHGPFGILGRHRNMPPIEIPNRSLFKPPEVCQIAGVPLYVLRTWEAEFPDLGVTRGGGRVYRRGDVERVLQIKHLLFVEGLTLAGARRKMGEEPRQDTADGPPIDELLGRDARERLLQVRQGLRELLTYLSRTPIETVEEPFTLRPRPGAGRSTPLVRPLKKTAAKSGKMTRRAKR